MTPRGTSAKIAKTASKPESNANNSELKIHERDSEHDNSLDVNADPRLNTMPCEDLDGQNSPFAMKESKDEESKK